MAHAPSRSNTPGPRGGSDGRVYAGRRIILYETTFIGGSHGFHASGRILPGTATPIRDRLQRLRAISPGSGVTVPTAAVRRLLVASPKMGVCNVHRAAPQRTHPSVSDAG